MGEGIDQNSALHRILCQIENSLTPSLMYIGGELEYQLLHILKDELPDMQERIDKALQRTGFADQDDESAAE